MAVALIISYILILFLALSTVHLYVRYNALVKCVLSLFDLGKASAESNGVMTKGILETHEVIKSLDKRVSNVEDYLKENGITKDSFGIDENLNN